MFYRRKNDVSNQYAWLFSVKGKEFTARDEEREETRDNKCGSEEKSL